MLELPTHCWIHYTTLRNVTHLEPARYQCLTWCLFPQLEPIPSTYPRDIKFDSRTLIFPYQVLRFQLLPVSAELSAVFDWVALETRPSNDVDSSSAGARKAENLVECNLGRFALRALILFDFVDSALTGSRTLLRDVRPGSSAGRSPGSSHLLKGRAPSSYGPGPVNGFVESCLSSRYVGVVGDPTSTSVEEVPVDQMC